MTPVFILMALFGFWVLVNGFKGNLANVWLGNAHIGTGG